MFFRMLYTCYLVLKRLLHATIHVIICNEILYCMLRIHLEKGFYIHCLYQTVTTVIEFNAGPGSVLHCRCSHVIGSYRKRCMDMPVSIQLM